MNAVKRILVFVFLSLGLLLCLFFLFLEMKSKTTPAYRQVPPSAYGTSKIVRGINIGNALEAPMPGEWGVNIQPDYFSTIRYAGFDSVRIPVRFSAHTRLEAPYEIDASFLSLVDSAVNPGLENGLIVILDLHHFEELMSNPAIQKSRFLAIWKQIAVHYQSASPNLYFELLNEPTLNMDADTWNRLLAETILIIRESNPQRKVVIGGVDYNNLDSLPLLQLSKEKNIIATFHFYEPFKFTHQGADWVENSGPWLGTSWMGEPAERLAVTSRFDQAVAWSEEHDIPLIMGEFGVINQADAASRRRWTEFITREAEKRNIGWLYWEFCSEFGVYSCDSQVWDRGLLNSLIPSK
jgi:endoglucanase